MIHITPSTMIPWYTLHRQTWTHDTHYIVKHEPMIHITPSSMIPWYTLHRQAWAHDTDYTFKHEPMIHIKPSSLSIRYKLRLQVLDIALREAPKKFQLLVWILKNIFSVWQSFSTHLIGKVCCTVWQKLCQDSEKIRNNASPRALA